MNRASNLRRNYGVTLTQYEEMMSAQCGVCAICGGTNPNGNQLSVDHDHSCCPGKKSCGGCVRALLCIKCNLGIGSLGDSPQRLRDAANYLEEHRR